MLALALSVALYALGLSLVFGVRDTRARRLFSSLLPLAALLLLLLLGGFLSPVERLFLSTVLMIGLIKCAVALRRPLAEVCGFSRLGCLLYFSIWPGMELRGFAQRVAWAPDVDAARALFQGAACCVLGVCALSLLSWFAPALSPVFLGWAGIAALLCAVHFGIGEMLPWLMRLAGFRTGKLFDAPLKSSSLADFWSRRWNLAFVEMNRSLFLRGLRKRLGTRRAVLGVFALSGVLHEMGLSFPAGAGWGGPMGYFLLHGVLTTFVEPRISSSLVKRALCWLAVFAPLPLLFHAPFHDALVLPLIHGLSLSLHARPFGWYLHAALWLGTVGHFCILGASFQVPKRLGWREDLARLSRFNRKVFWTYGAFIVLCIVSFGVLTGVLHDELLRGDKAAVALSLFIGVFWTARVLTDLFYFKHDDWPQGAEFELGHVLLTLLFCALALLFGVVVPLVAVLHR